MTLARFAGFFDLRLAARLFGDAISTYTGFWIVCKLAMLGSIYFFCYQSATRRQQVEIDL